MATYRLPYLTLPYVQSCACAPLIGWGTRWLLVDHQEREMQEMQGRGIHAACGNAVYVRIYLMRVAASIADSFLTDRRYKLLPQPTMAEFSSPTSSSSFMPPPIRGRGRAKKQRTRGLPLPSVRSQHRSQLIDGDAFDFKTSQFVSRRGTSSCASSAPSSEVEEGSLADDEDIDSPRFPPTHGGSRRRPQSARRIALNQNRSTAAEDGYLSSSSSGETASGDELDKVELDMQQDVPNVEVDELGRIIDVAHNGEDLHPTLPTRNAPYQVSGLDILSLL